LLSIEIDSLWCLSCHATYGKGKGCTGHWVWHLLIFTQAGRT